MSIISCFTCSGMTGAVAPMSNTYWGVLCSLLLPDQNIEHVCFPNSNLHLCTKCMDTLHHISEFRSVAINSVRAMLERWNSEMNPPGSTPYSVKLEFENVGTKQEIMDEDTVYDRADLHEEVTLETADEISSQVKIEQETLNSTEYSQNEQEDSYHWLSGGAQYYNEGDGTEDNLDWMTESEAIGDDAADPEDANRSKISLSSARETREKIGPSKRPLEPPRKKKKKYNIKKINNKELEAYRSSWLDSEQFRGARHKCADCLVVFDTRTGRNEHRAQRHSNKRHLHKCIVCKQTMIGVRLTKHIASHFELIECKKCGHLAHDENIMAEHSCTNRPINTSGPILRSTKFEFRFVPSHSR